MGGIKADMQKLLSFLLGVLLFAPALSIADGADWDQPTLGTLYSAWPDKVKDLATSAASLSYTGDLNLPTGVLQYNRSTKVFEEYNGATFTAKEITGLADGAVSSAAKLADSVVTSAKILDATIANGDIANSTIQGGKIASATITGSNIASATVAGSNIASATVTGSNIASATITDTNLASDSVTTAKILASNVTAAKMALAFTSCSCPSLSSSGSVISSVTTTGCGKLQLGNIVFYYFQCDFTVGTLATNNLDVSLSPTPANNSYLIPCIADGNNGVFARLRRAGSGPAIVRLDGGQWTIGSGRTVQCSGFYEY